MKGCSELRTAVTLLPLRYQPSHACYHAASYYAVSRPNLLKLCSCFLRIQADQLIMAQTLSTAQARVRRRTDYRYFLTYQTRWSDNDQYSHVNNSVYYHFFDSIVNQYLVTNCNLSPQTSPLIGLVVSSWSLYFSPVSFPENLELALRVNKLGNSSVTYEVGVFRGGSQEPSAVGGYTHVFVERNSRKSAPLDDTTRKGLEKLFVVTLDDGGSGDNPTSKL
ncbi:hypothetical protein EVG20_g263 [Dentipellis fragilis]|uniref:Thioesterase domain-containing protein n=1 Tax=Dentipellis fragilis TaxID=205917 RepID=A0A4Y9ZFI3_9AGAM|nr:hypothetical protein EVG20_g263 [Dentipellis fragilis]